MLVHDHSLAGVEDLEETEIGFQALIHGLVLLFIVLDPRLEIFHHLVLVELCVIRAGDLDFTDIVVDDIFTIAHGLDEEQLETLVYHNSVVQLFPSLLSGVGRVEYSNLKLLCCVNLTTVRECPKIAYLSIFMLQPVQEVCKSFVADPLPQCQAFLVVVIEDVISRVLGLDSPPVFPQIEDLSRI